MRMWMIDPALLCRRHLLGEHNELHMLTGSILRGKKLDGFVSNGLIEPAALADRHQILAHDMLRRGYRHASPLPPCTAQLAAYPVHIRTSRVDVAVSIQDLTLRCPECAQRIEAAGQLPATMQQPVPLTPDIAESLQTLRPNPDASILSCDQAEWDPR